jgi:signal transduction histidine kinase
LKKNQDLVKQTKVVQELSARLLQLQDEERRRIARELHDSTGQLLAALSMSVAVNSYRFAIAKVVGYGGELLIKFSE